MPVLIENLQEKIDISDKINDILKKAVEMSLRLENFELACEVNIMLVDNETIRHINNEQRKIDKATDVLSFPMLDFTDGKLISTCGDYNLDENLLLLGDIVISLERVQEQSIDYGHSFERELAFLTTHGVFHLLGYDHGDKEEEKEMMDRQEAVLQQMGLGR